MENSRREIKPLKSNLKVSSSSGNEKKSSVTFNLVNEVEPSRTHSSYSDVKNRLKAKLSDIKLKRQYSNNIIEKTEEDYDSDLKKNNNNNNENQNTGPMTYYVLECENDFNFWHFQEPEIDMKGIITEVTTSLEDLTDSNIYFHKNLN